jgi:hypothetical protein
MKHALFVLAEKLYTEWWTTAVGVPCWENLHQRQKDAWVNIAAVAAAEVRKIPIPMRLPCEKCGVLHIDEGRFATEAHETHVCQGCGLAWKPARVPTVGVAFLPGYKNEAPTPKTDASAEANKIEQAAREADDVLPGLGRLVREGVLVPDPTLPDAAKNKASPTAAPTPYCGACGGRNNMGYHTCNPAAAGNEVRNSTLDTWTLETSAQLSALIRLLVQNKVIDPKELEKALGGQP